MERTIKKEGVEHTMGQQNAAMSYSLPYAVRVSWPPFVIFTVLGLLISFPLLSIIQRGPSAVLPVVVILCMVWGSIGILLLVIGLQKIVLLPDRIRYTSLFLRREMLFSDIRRIEVKATPGRGGGYFLEIYGASSPKPLAISVKPFPRKGISVIVDVIATHTPSVTLDQKASQLREGVFKW